nr:hypothetical protein [Tanacetum cinerariifolium]
MTKPCSSFSANCLNAGTLPMLQPRSSEVKFIKSRFQCQITVGGIVSPKNSQVKLKEPKKILDALQDPSWVEAMHEELLQFKILNVWSLVDCPKEDEGIDYDEVFAPVARIKAIRLFLAYASFMGFTVYQMDVKSAFLYCTIDEEVYVMQPPGFQDPEFPARVYKVEKAISANTPMDKENPWGKDKTGIDVDLHHYRSMIRSLMYLTASRPDIMFAVCACARHQVTPKECHMRTLKRIFRYQKGHPKIRLWYPKESSFDLVVYSDSDYGGASQDRKSTTEGCQFLGRRLISWQCKKQTIMANSTTKAKYVAAAIAVDKFCGFRISCLIMGGDYGNVFQTGFNGIQWIETTKEGTKILATVDGKLRTFSESSIRRNLKLNDEFSHQWKYLIHKTMQCLSPKSTGFNEFSSNIATALVCLANNRVYNFSKMIFDGMGEGSGTPTESYHTPTSEASQSSHHELPSPSLPLVPTKSLPTVITSDNPPLRQYTRRARIAQSSALPPVANEHASPIRDDSQREACPTDSGLTADQDRANIPKTSTLPSDSTPRVTSLAVDEGSIQQKLHELMALCTSLQRKQSEM